MVWDDGATLYPDTLVGTDSHTTMVNGLGVLGWGVGGIEAEAAMVGQPIAMLLPQVVGVRLIGHLPAGATATDLVLRVTEVLRRRGVVGRFVEFCGPGLAAMPVADRATIANMSPEYGATIGFFPVDQQTLAYLRLTGRDEALVETVEQYCRLQGLWRDEAAEPPYTEMVEIDLGAVVPSLAGPRRPQDRVDLDRARESWRAELAGAFQADAGARATVAVDGESCDLTHGSVVIAAITSCTNTSNPDVMVAAGLLARQRPPTRPHSPPLGQDLVRPGVAGGDPLPRRGRPHGRPGGAGLPRRRLRVHHLHRQLGPAARTHRRRHPRPTAWWRPPCCRGTATSKGRISPDVRANYLASPPLVVAYALAGTVDIDLTRRAAGARPGRGPGVPRRPVAVREESRPTWWASALSAAQYREVYPGAFTGSAPSGGRWRPRPGPSTPGRQPAPTCLEPPFFAGLAADPGPLDAPSGVPGSCCPWATR